MNCRLQAGCSRKMAGSIKWSVVMCIAMLSCGAARAQGVQSAVGAIQGSDVSISSGTPGVNAGQVGAAGAPVINGSIITVRSGQARVTLEGGGIVDICGPAKLTLLRSGDATTVALDFGRVRVEVPASTNLRIFTPTVIATPLDIGGAARDITLGLELDDSLCVKATGGALLLENQFSAEKLVVPQAGEFFFAQGKLVPVVKQGSQCECDADLVHAGAASPPLPSLGLMAPAQVVPAGQTVSAPVPEDDPAPKSNIEFSTLAHPNETHPMNVRPKPESPAAPPEAMPTYKIVMPPLVFSANSPAPPEPTMDMVMLIRSVEVQPEWEFKGHVNPPPGDEGGKAGYVGNGRHSRQPKPAGARGGFWAKMKRFFGGSNS